MADFLLIVFYNNIQYMSSNKHDGNSRKHKQQTPKKPIPTGNSSDKMEGKKEEPKTEKNRTEYICNEHPKIDITVNQPDRWNIANTISAISIIINIGMLIATYCILKSAQQSAKSAEDSFKATDNSLKQTQRDFELEKRPYFQITNIKINKVEIGVKPEINFKVINMGQFPGKFDSLRVNFYFEDLKPSYFNDIYFKSPIAFLDTSTNTSLSSGGMTFPIGISYSVKFNKMMSDMMDNSAGFFYLFGTINYESPITNKNFQLHYVYKIAILPNRKTSIICLINNDREIKS
ncbi:MAG: hypothetical protein JST87_11385 [Bacteroidetes bacterium]|nr:hypothetical protein [Bacteroidota bacterium]